MTGLGKIAPLQAVRCRDDKPRVQRTEMTTPYGRNLPRSLMNAPKPVRRFRQRR
jgi:hypothetical protein